MSGPLPGWPILFVAALAGLAWETGAWGAEGAPPAVKEAPPLVYRRMFAPADRMELWPRGGARLVPMQAAEFERLTSIARMAASGSDASIAAAVASAGYRAKLSGDVLTEGEASLEIVHTAQGAVMLPLDPCGLAVSKAAWSVDESKPAQLGLGADGKLRVLVERSGMLKLAWSLRGRRDAAGAEDFSLELPPAPSSHLILDLPEKTVPLVDHGIVVKDANEEKGAVRWRIELGGNHRLRLRILPGEDLATAGPLTRVRQSLDYKFSLHGLDLDARFQLDVHNEPLRQIAVSMDRGLQLVSARCGNAPVAWSVMAPTPDSRSLRVVLEFPEPIQGTGRVLSLGTVAPLRTDARWKLPSIRPEGLFWQEGAATLAVARPLLLEQLLVHRGRQFRLESLLPPNQGERTEIQLFSPEAELEVLLARAQSPLLVDSATSIELTGGQMTGRVGANFHLADGERYQLQADIGRGWIIDSVDSLPAEAIGDWDVEEAEALAPAATPAVSLATGKRQLEQISSVGNALRGVPQPAEKGILPSRNATEGVPYRRKLVVRWTQALSPARPAQLLVSGRRLHSPLGESLSIDDLVPLVFRASAGAHRLVAVSAVEPYQVKVSGAEQVSLLSPASLDSSVAKLFARPPRGVVFENTPAAAGLKFSLENQRPQYAAAIHVEATVSDRSLAESYRLVCTPESARVQRLVVEFSPHRQGPLRWTLVGDGEDPPTARPLPSGIGPFFGGKGRLAHSPGAENRDLSPLAAAAQPGEDRQRWEILLRKPKSTPFEIRAVRTSALELLPASPQPVSLASLPEATRQQATLTVAAIGSRAVRIAARLLEPLPIEVPDAGRYTTVRAAYRYDPSHNVPSAPQAVLYLLPAAAGSDGPAAWAWSCRLQSRLDDEGTGRHLVTYRLENSGRRRLTVALPGGVSLGQVRGIWVDGVRAAWQSSGRSAPHAPREGMRHAERDECNRLEVELPAGERYPVVRLQYTTHGPPLGLVSRLDPPLPTLEVPVLARQWTVWIPPGYLPGDPDPRWQTPRDEPPSWSQRLLGPLGQPAGHRPFDPARMSDWTGLVDSRYPALAAAKATELVERIGRYAALCTSSGKARGAGVPPAQRAVPPAQAAGTAAPQERAGDWGSFLSDPAVLGLFSTSVNAVRGPTLLVDGEALDRLGLTPRTPIGATDTRGVAKIDGVGILDQAGLAFLVHDDALVLTAADEVALDRGQLVPLRDGVGWQVLPGPLWELIHLAATAEKEPDGSLPIPAAAWTQLHRQAEMPWSASRLAGYQSGDTLGWRACRLELSDRQPVHLTVVRRSAMEALRWAIFLAVVAAVSWWGVDRTAVIIALAGLLAAAALLLPGTLATIVSGALLGTLLGLAFPWVRQRPVVAAAGGPGPSGKSPSSVSTLTHAATQLGWLIVLSGGALGLPALARAADPALPNKGGNAVGWVSRPVPDGSGEPSYMIQLAAGEATTPAAATPAAAAAPAGGQPAAAVQQAAPSESRAPAAVPPLHNVFIPIDKQDRPTGDKYYLSEDLYNELHRRAAAVTDEPQGWLLGSATYHAVLAWQAAPDRLVLNELRASFELVVFGAGRGSAFP